MRRFPFKALRACDGPADDLGLTPSERWVAAVAASRMTNRDVAAALSIGPKTVAANLGRMYRKRGIKARPKLGRTIRDL
jgi:DNA-binding CsgD family transcriptional regulator